MKEPKAHKDWYDDGDDGTQENLWRMDYPDVQTQLFWHKKTGEYRLFIEHDVRDVKHNHKRVKYSGEFFPCNTKDGAALLKSNKNQVGVLLAPQIKKIKALPNDPAYCK